MTEYYLELTGTLRQVDDDGNDTGMHPDRDVAERLFTRLADHWFHDHHYRWLYRLPLVGRRLTCRRCEKDISGSAKLRAGEMTLDILFTDGEDR
jgi:hypothetical protein